MTSRFEFKSTEESTIFGVQYFQQYTDAPEVVHLKPVRPRQLPKLRRKGVPPDDLGPVDDQDVVADEGMEDDSETVTGPVENGKFYVILGDCPDGYYVVRCSVVSEDKFTGRYTKEIAELDSNNIAFKETRSSDVFFFKSIVSELVVIPDLNENSSRFMVNKVEMDEVLLKVSEMS